ncbi:MAG: ribosomal RNA small subunit methyltransferase E [Burkholderiales bacterium]
MTPRLYLDPALGALSEGAEIVLPAGAAHHALRVLRLRAGDAVTLFDGTGGEWRAAIASALRREASVRVAEHRAIERESPLAIRLALAVLATDAMDYAVRKAVELGAAAIEPVVAARSQGASRSNRGEHWRRIVLAACEQCGRNRIPPIEAPRPLDDWLAARGRATPGVVLVPEANVLLATIAPAGVLDLLVGPEGGFDAREVDAALRSGLRAAALGPRVLKAETACVAALSVLQAGSGDLR